MASVQDRKLHLARRWSFTKQQLEDSPSRQSGMSARKEKRHKERAANVIRDMGHILDMPQIQVDRAITLLHRFYTVHSLRSRKWKKLVTALVYLSYDGEDEEADERAIIRAARRQGMSVVDDDLHAVRDLRVNLGMVSEALEFNYQVQPPHFHLMKFMSAAGACRQLRTTCYNVASASLQLTSMCLSYTPTQMACFSIIVACVVEKQEIPNINGNNEWFTDIDVTLTGQELQKMVQEYLPVFQKHFANFKKL